MRCDRLASPPAAMPCLPLPCVTAMAEWRPLNCKTQLALAHLPFFCRGIYSVTAAEWLRHQPSPPSEGTHGPDEAPCLQPPAAGRQGDPVM